MATSRTGTTEHLQWRKRVLARDRSAGITNCPLCGRLLDYETSRLPNSAEPDHITPYAYGGGYTMDNGRTICRQCNQSRGKGSKPQPDRTKVTASPIW